MNSRAQVYIQNVIPEHFGFTLQFDSFFSPCVIPET